MVRKTPVPGLEFHVVPVMRAIGQMKSATGSITPQPAVSSGLGEVGTDRGNDGVSPRQLSSVDLAKPKAERPPQRLSLACPVYWSPLVMVSVAFPAAPIPAMTCGLPPVMERLYIVA